MTNRIIRLQDIVEEVLKHHPEEDTSIIEKAYVFSAKAHEGQLRLSGEPYLSHPLEVAYLLAQMGLGPVTVSAACCTTRWRTPPPPWTTWRSISATK